MTARSARLGAILLAASLAGCGQAAGETSGADGAEVAPLPQVVQLPPVLEAVPVREIPEPPALTGPSPPAEMDVSELPAPVFERPEHIRGIYLNAWVSGSRARRDELIELARRTEINTFVIDVKDATGYLSYGTRVELAREIGADRERRIRGIRELLHRLHQEDIYPIARIVIFKDPLLAVSRPDLAVQDQNGGPWIDGKGDLWVNPWDREIWDYHIELAREAVELGFPEIQWDYIRFPDRPAEEMASAVFPGAEGRPRTVAVRAFLEYTRESLSDLGVPLTADVFGLATTLRRDVGIGQTWEDFVDAVDAVLPMVYPSHYWRGSYGFEAPNDRPYEVVAGAVRDAVRRSEGVEGAARIIPWLQNFTLGPPFYGAAEVRAQILATYDQGVYEWILWNASGRYTEGALEPVGGWPGGLEPPIRFGGVVMNPEWRFVPAPHGAPPVVTSEAGEEDQEPEPEPEPEPDPLTPSPPA